MSFLSACSFSFSIRPSFNTIISSGFLLQMSGEVVAVSVQAGGGAWRPPVARNPADCCMFLPKMMNLC